LGFWIAPRNPTDESTEATARKKRKLKLQSPTLVITRRPESKDVLEPIGQGNSPMIISSKLDPEGEQPEIIGGHFKPDI
jgi:hypothetical protein